MISKEADLIQNKIVGVVLRDARTQAGKSIQECAQQLFCSPDYLAQAEEGLVGLTLPQTEALAHLLNVPLERFLGQEQEQQDQEAVREQALSYDNVMTIRRKIIGVIIRQARLESGQTLDDLAATLEEEPERLARIELGEEQIPLTALRTLGEMLGIDFGTFVAKYIIPLTPAEQKERDLQRLANLPQEVREFILKPINMPYLQIAMNLSSMPAEALRQIASGLLEITY